MPLYTTVSKNSLSVRYFSCEFDSWVMLVCLLDEGFSVLFTHVPYGKDIVNVAFPNSRFRNGFA